MQSTPNHPAAGQASDDGWNEAQILTSLPDGELVEVEELAARLVAAEAAVADVDLSALHKLASMGKIPPDEAKSGERFARDFELAYATTGYARSKCAERVDGGTGENPIDSYMRARRRVQALKEYLSGPELKPFAYWETVVAHCVKGLSAQGIGQDFLNVASPNSAAAHGLRHIVTALGHVAYFYRTRSF
jgi:hypothetical protein